METLRDGDIQNNLKTVAFVLCSMYTVADWSEHNCVEKEINSNCVRISSYRLKTFLVTMMSLPREVTFIPTTESKIFQWNCVVWSKSFEYILVWTIFFY